MSCRRHRSRWRMPTRRTSCVAPRRSIDRASPRCSRPSTSTSIATSTSPAIRRACSPDRPQRRPACRVTIRTRATFPPRHWPSRWEAEWQNETRNARLTNLFSLFVCSAHISWTPAPSRPSASLSSASAAQWAQSALCSTDAAM